MHKKTQFYLHLKGWIYGKNSQRVGWVLHFMVQIYKYKKKQHFENKMKKMLQYTSL